MKWNEVNNQQEYRRTFSENKWLGSMVMAFVTVEFNCNPNCKYIMKALTFDNESINQ